MGLNPATFVFAVFLTIVAACGQTPAVSQLIHDVRVFDGEQVLEHRSVLVEDGKISRIGGAELKITNAEVVEGLI